MKIELSNDELAITARALRNLWGWTADGSVQQGAIAILHQRIARQVPGEKAKFDEMVRRSGRPIDKSGLTGL